MTATAGWAHSYVTFAVPGAKGTIALGVNSAGAATGYYYGKTNQGFLRSPSGQITTFDVPGAVSTLPFGINEGGAITGYYTDASNNSHGFVRLAHGPITTFDVPDAAQTFPFTIDREGTATGVYSYGPSGESLGGFVRYRGGVIATFQGGDFASINAAGTVAGTYLDGAQIQAFLRSRDGQITPYTVAGSIATYSSWINKSGTVAGKYTDSSGATHGFVRAPNGAIKPFDPPGPITPTSNGLAIDEHGKVAGSYSDGQRLHGFLRYASRTIRTFDPPGSTGTYVYGVNPAGAVVGSYTDKTSRTRGFIRIP